MLPVLRPDLPTSAELRPYLERIDANGQYTNDGPLVRELERRLGGVCVANATLGLELAARYVFREGVVRVPAFTFPATLTAVLRAGLTPVLCDINPRTWEAAEVDARTLNVCPFGFVSKRGGPLVDAAAVSPGPQLVNCVVSLHATKALPAGEGAVVYGSEGLLDYVRYARNFGFEGGVIQHHGGTNAKMSEYHAAVALASLERYPALATKRRALALAYEARLPDCVETRSYQGGTVYPVLLDDPSRAKTTLSAAGVETRQWYYPALDGHPAFYNVETEDLSNAHAVSRRLLCLPFHTYMTEADVDRVCEVLCAM